MAGLSRALSLSNEENDHRDFVLDLIAPLYSSWLYQILEDANANGIKRLYFCARDSYQIHKMALCISHLFPNIGIEYVYISREALKENNEANKIAYFEKIGLASKEDDVAIVDSTTGGKTLLCLNSILQKYGFKFVSGYYFQLHKWVEEVEKNLYKGEAREEYVKMNPNLVSLFNWELTLMFEK